MIAVGDRSGRFEEIQLLVAQERRGCVRPSLHPWFSGGSARVPEQVLSSYSSERLQYWSSPQERCHSSLHHAREEEGVYRFRRCRGLDMRPSWPLMSRSLLRLSSTLMKQASRSSLPISFITSSTASPSTLTTFVRARRTLRRARLSSHVLCRSFLSRSSTGSILLLWGWMSSRAF